MVKTATLKVLALTVIMAVVAGCGSKPAATSAPAATEAPKEPIKIGVVTSLTGPNAATGIQVATGAKLAAKEWNDKGGVQGRKIDVQVEDDQGTPTGATNAHNKIAASKPAGVVLPTFAQLVMALEPAVKQLAVPSLTSATGVAITKQGNPWFFRTRTNDEVMGKLAANFAADELKTKKPGVLYANNDYGKGGYAVIKATLEAKSIQLVGAESFNSGDKDFTAQLLNLKKAGSDLIIIWSTPADSAVIALQQKQLSLGVQILGSPGWGVKEFFDLVKGAADGQYGLVDYAGGSSDRIKAWEKAVDDSAKGIPASFVTGAAYDGLSIMLGAMNKVGTDPAKVRDAMLATQNYDGIIGTFSFDKEGNGLKQAVIFKIENNAMKVIKSVKE
ncbi:MAG TPA: ABC transporter substrate-binding protein [Symbiobacteriaceae bacterium]|jgi:branched-chain amino acid transport system substrate-binding protein